MANASTVTTQQGVRLFNISVESFTPVAKNTRMELVMPIEKRKDMRIIGKRPSKNRLRIKIQRAVITGVTTAAVATGSPTGTIGRLLLPQVRPFKTAAEPLILPWSQNNAIAKLTRTVIPAVSIPVEVPIQYTQASESDAEGEIGVVFDKLYGYLIKGGYALFAVMFAIGILGILVKLLTIPVGLTLSSTSLVAFIAIGGSAYLFRREFGD